MKSREDFLQELVKVFPFLMDLPKELFLQIDTSQFYLPSTEHLPLIRQLEQVLQAHIMLYRAEPQLKTPSGKVHLCCMLAPASLQTSQFALLQAVEKRTYFVEKVIWVAYAKPLAFHKQFIDPITS